VFKQVVTIQPILWRYVSSSIDPMTILGFNKWVNYRLQVSALLNNKVQASSYVAIMGRIGPDSFDARRYGFPPGYTFQVFANGTWNLWRGYQNGNSVALSKGSVTFSRNAWHTIEIGFSGNTVRAAFNGATVATVSDNVYPRGLAGLGSGFHESYFDNFIIATS